MIVIPAINCEDIEEVRDRVDQARQLFAVTPVGYQQWIHLDIADGSFTNGYTSWRNPADVSSLRLPANISLEAHIMVNNPEEIFAEWVSAGIKRIIVHLSATQHLEAIVNTCKERQVQVMLALEPSVPIEHALPYLPRVNGCQLLTVSPGRSAQMLDPATFTRIKAVKSRFPSLLVEVDGGINPLTTRACKDAGADMVASSSYIFQNNDPLRAFQELLHI